jgi:hypothetical protein
LIEQQNTEISAQKQAIKDMEKKNECVYQLLQQYNKCEETHEKGSSEYFECLKDARSKNNCP